MAAYLWMLTGAFAFACMGAFAHGLESTITWQAIALARAGLALVFAALLAAAAGVPLVVWRPRTLWIRSIAGSISMLCTFYALPRLPVGEVFTLSNLFPVWVALLSWPLLKEKPPGAVWLAIGCAVCGVILVEQPGVGATNFAALVVVAGSFTTAIAMIGLHRLSNVDVRAVVVHFSAVATLFCAASLWLLPNERTASVTINPKIVAMLVGVGLTATVGQLLLTKAFALGNPAKVSVVALTQIGFALAFDVLFWDRALTASTLAGTALVVGPTAWLMRRDMHELPLEAPVEVG